MGRGGGERAADLWAPTTVPRGLTFKMIQTKIQMVPNKFKNHSNSNRCRKDLPGIKNEIKYGWEGFEEKNNFLHRNFFSFEMNFK
jgi:hypothetical protein